MAVQISPSPGADAMASAEKTPSTPPKISVRRRPSRSAAMPLGTSHSRLVRWNTPSARPISASEKPRAASSATQTASVNRSVEKNACRYTQRSCFCKFIGNTLSLKNHENVPFFAHKKRPAAKPQGAKMHTLIALPEVRQCLKKGTLTASTRQGFPFFWNTTPNCQRIRVLSFPVNLALLYHTVCQIARKIVQ